MPNFIAQSVGRTSRIVGTQLLKLQRLQTCHGLSAIQWSYRRTAASEIKLRV